METRDGKIFKKYKSARNAVSREIKKKLSEMSNKMSLRSARTILKNFGII